MKFMIPKGTDKIPFSIRVNEKEYTIINKLAAKNDKSINYIINCMIKYAIENMNMDEIKNIKNDDI